MKYITLDEFANILIQGLKEEVTLNGQVTLEIRTVAQNEPNKFYNYGSACIRGNIYIKPVGQKQSANDFQSYEIGLRAEDTPIMEFKCNTIKYFDGRNVDPKEKFSQYILIPISQNKSSKITISNITNIKY